MLNPAWETNMPRLCFHQLQVTEKFISPQCTTVHLVLLHYIPFLLLKVIQFFLHVSSLLLCTEGGFQPLLTGRFRSSSFNNYRLLKLNPCWATWHHRLLAFWKSLQFPLCPPFSFPSGQTFNNYSFILMISCFHIVTILSTEFLLFLFRGIFAHPLAHAGTSDIACFKNWHIRKKCLQLMHQLHCFHLHREFRDRALFWRWYSRSKQLPIYRYIYKISSKNESRCI